MNVAVGRRLGAEESASTPGVLGAHRHRCTKSAEKCRSVMWAKCPSSKRKLRTPWKEPPMNHRDYLTIVGVEGISISERWLPIPSDPNYLVSDTGKVYSKRSKIVLKPRRRGKNYAAVTLTGGTFRYTHHLVAEAWIGPRPTGLHVLHRDDVKSHNDVDNLYYGSQHQNHLDQLRNGKHPFAARTACGRGHEYTAENTRFRMDGKWRDCRACARDRRAARKAAA